MSNYATEILYLLLSLSSAAHYMYNWDPAKDSQRWLNLEIELATGY